MIKSIWRWVQRLLAVAGLGACLVVLTPVAEQLARPLRLAPDLKSAQAIVVLGGGAFKDGIPSPASVERAVYGLSLLRAGYGPRLLLSSGQARPEFGNEAAAMKRLLEGIGAADKLLEIEERSTRTYSNAVESARLLKPQGVKRILLVTHPNHMLRAKLTFEKAGFEVLAAPLPWDRLPERWMLFRIGRVKLLYDVAYEYGAILLYWWRGWL